MNLFKWIADLFTVEHNTGVGIVLCPTKAAITGQYYFVWKRGEWYKLTDNHTTEEFECKCGKCEDQRINTGLIAKIQLTENRLGRELKINSAFRCGMHQLALRKRGKKTAKGVSTHEMGDAADIRVYPNKLGILVGTKALRKILPSFFKAIGDGRKWFHVDLRMDKIRRWEY